MKKYLYALIDRIADCVLGVQMSPQKPDEFVTEQNRMNALSPQMDRSTMTIHFVGMINDVTGQIEAVEPEKVGDFSKSVAALENRRNELYAQGTLKDPGEARKQI